MEQYYPVYFVRGASEFTSKNELSHFNIHSKTLQKTIDYIPSKDSVTIAITSGASCPDAIMDKVIHRILEIFEIKNNLDQIFS
jgi:4-hydroxy-3-methylbut-2-enyl diphosphate reductase